MNYEGQICRGPMERSSFMLPVAVGCSYNGCKFCNLFRHLKYRQQCCKYKNLCLKGVCYELCGIAFVVFHKNKLL